MEEVIEEALSKGVELHMSGEFDLARQLYDGVIELQADHAEANHNMGLLMLDMGQALEALPYLQTALQADMSVSQFWLSYIKALTKLERLDEAGRILDLAKESGFEGEEFTELSQILSAPAQHVAVSETTLDTSHPPQEMIDLLIKLYNQGQLAEVDKQAKMLVEQYPDTFIVWNIIGLTAAQNGDFDHAIEAFEKAISLNPTDCDTHNNLGLALQYQNKLDEAIVSYNRALSLKPDYTDAYYNKGVSLQDQGKLEEAIETYKEVLALIPGHIDAHYNMGLALQEHGRLDDAIEAYNKVLLIKPDYVEAHNNMGNALKEQNKLEEALEAYRKAISIKPGYAQAYYNMGNVLKDHDKPQEALHAYNKALSFKPDNAEAYSNLGSVLNTLGKLDEAIEVYQKALSINPDFTEAYYNMGNALKEQGKLDVAIDAYNKAISIKPDYAEVHYNMGLALQEQGKLNDAISSYNKAILHKSDYPEAYNNMGNVLKDQEKLDEALSNYERALTLKPSYAEAYYNMGNALKKQRKLDDAIDAYNKAISVKPDYVEAYNNMGLALQEQGKLNDAIDSFENVLVLDPNNSEVRAHKLHQQAHICDWQGIESERAHLENLGIEGRFVQPFSALSLEDIPQKHLQRSVNFGQQNFPPAVEGQFVKPLQKPERLRIGYFSADFYDHATMHLFSGILEAHDKAQFEVIAFSYGPNFQDETRRRMLNDVDIFYDVHEMTDKQIVKLAKKAHLHIAIDLKGFTKDSRLIPFAHRLAPVQISYLGYPGTLGTEFIDYIVADPIVIPEDKRQCYAEQIIYLPNSYQPNDAKREISDKVFTRENVGLPSDTFVFCCFNGNYKISSREFDIWMRILKKLDGSVLWLFKSNTWAEQNLKREAELRGVDSNRLIFAENLPPSENLARLKLADLFLDTFNVNAHTTASDALWAGLPLVTKLGNGFAARVGGSILNAIGLPDLITKNEADYETLIIDLATTPGKLLEVKKRLDANRLSKPLFDTKRYTKHLETGYQLAYQRFFDGKQTGTVMVPNNLE